ncbi:MAG: isoprenoid biosynthesis glyoxalase ElbB [Bacteroidales bacterium]|nr:isoprenoid biosynthesis glyoxalase ElbB [Bacteroidales bacterium]
MKKFAVVLCGCGCYDGSEIHESVMTLLAIDRNECQYSIFAPDADQYHVINHYTKQATDEKRNMLAEAARIARGDIQPLTALKVSDFDAIVFPGGFGAAKNLFTYAVEGTNAVAIPEVERVVRDFYAAHKPIGALCIAPVMIAKILGNVTITVGVDQKTIADVESFGAKHINTQQTEVIADKENKVFTTPCYMLPATIADIADCADNLIKAILENL